MNYTTTNPTTFLQSVEACLRLGAPFSALADRRRIRTPDPGYPIYDTGWDFTIVADYDKAIAP